MSTILAEVQYTVPFSLNRHPSSLWANLFKRIWNSPPQYTSMHRPGIARVQGDTIILNGTTLDEVKKYHRDTLVLCVSEANKNEEQITIENRRKADVERERSETHRKSVRDLADDIDFE